MGIVYRALDRDRDVTVAVKTLREMDAENLLRFKNEFRTLQGLQHPNLVNLGELVESGGHWFFTMELVEGINFFSYVRPRRCAVGTDREIFGDEPTAEAAFGARPRAYFDEEHLRSALRQLADALGTMHAAGFVHRDIKPSNILVTDAGRAVLLDFGFVIGIAQRSSDRVVGTATYMAPEQAASQPVTAAADWYALGVMLYEALTGSPPIDGMPIEVLVKKQQYVAPRPSTLVDGIPNDLDDLCMELLAISPAARPSGAEILRRLGGPTTPAAAGRFVADALLTDVHRARERARRARGGRGARRRGCRLGRLGPRRVGNWQERAGPRVLPPEQRWRRPRL